MVSLEINLAFTAFLFVAVFALEYVRTRKTRKIRVTLGLAFATVLVFQVVAGIPQDGIRAVRGTEAGDRWRLVLDHQTARVMGVPVALNEYGVEPEQEDMQ